MASWHSDGTLCVHQAWSHEQTLHTSSPSVRKTFLSVMSGIFRPSLWLHHNRWLRREENVLSGAPSHRMISKQLCPLNWKCYLVHRTLWFGRDIVCNHVLLKKILDVRYLVFLLAGNPWVSVDPFYLGFCQRLALFGIIVIWVYYIYMIQIYMWFIVFIWTKLSILLM